MNYLLNKIVVIIFLVTLLFSSGLCYEKHINCGGSEPVEDEGFIWEPDQPFDSAGAGYVGGEPTAPEWGVWQIGGTFIHMLFQNHRQGFEKYAFAAPSGGYIVRLELAECKHHISGRRIFSIVAEDSTIVSNIDLYAFVGKDYAVTAVFYIEVDDDTLDISLPASVGEPLLAGISVRSIEPDSTAPRQPDWVEAYPGYNYNIVRWEPIREMDVAGYMVLRKIPGGEWENITPAGTPLWRHIDKSVTPDSSYVYAVATYDVFGNLSEISYETAAVSAMAPGATDLPIYELYIENDQLNILADDPWSDDYIHGAFVCEDDSFPYVEIRHRGNVSRAVSKKSWKVKFSSTDLFEDRRKLNLASEFQDPSFMRNHYAYNLYCRVGIDAPFANFANLWLNDEFYGVFLSLEQVDEAYLRHRHYSEDDIIYRCEWLAFYEADDYSWLWEIENGTDDFDELEDMIKLVTRTPDTEIEAVLDSAFDVESLLRYYAIIVLTGDNDFSMHNIYMHREDTDSGKWHLVPWDHNVSFENPDIEFYPLDQGTHYSPETIGGGNTLWTRMMRTENYRERYCELLDSLTLYLFTAALFGEYRDSTINYIDRDVRADYRKGTFEDNWAWEWHIEHLAYYVSERVEQVRANIEDFRELQNPKGIFINEICASNDSALADDYGEYDDWVELYNSNPFSINLEGLYLTDDIDSLISWELPNVDIAARGHLLLWLDNQPGQGELHGPFKLDADGEFIGLFDKVEHEPWEEPWFTPRAIDLVWFGEQKTDTTWSRYPDGSDNWEFTLPTPEGVNVSDIGEEIIAMPRSINLKAYPNPFNSSCRIRIQEVEDSRIQGIEIFDLRGNVVGAWRRHAQPTDTGKGHVNAMSQQNRTFIWRPASEIDSGIYFAVVILEDRQESMKLIYLK